MPHHIAIATVAAAHGLDDDLAPLVAALDKADIEHTVANWDDPSVVWSQFDAVLLRSTWDYAQRLPEFLTWCEQVAAHSTLLNPLDLVRWNTDKHYLLDLANSGVAIVESVFVLPGESATRFPDYAEFVVKPAIGAGSRDTQRYTRAERSAALEHIQRLLQAQRAVLIQPYLDAVDSAGETALIFFDGTFSHAIRKGPLLQRNTGATELLFAPEKIDPRAASRAEHELAQHVLDALPFPTPLYARVDLLPSPQGPRLLELELTEPSLFFNTADGSAARFITALGARLERIHAERT